MPLGLGAALLGASSFIQGGGFGLGYGVGVRAGYEDLYPFLKSTFLALGQSLKPTQFASGLNLAMQSQQSPSVQQSAQRPQRIVFGRDPSDEVRPQHIDFPPSH